MLKSNLFKVNQANFTNMRHIVLGTNLDTPLTNPQEEVLFGCGCFWGAEKGFWKLPGVVSTSVGYAGGDTNNPTYNQVCSGKTKQGIAQCHACMFLCLTHSFIFSVVTFFFFKFFF